MDSLSKKAAKARALGLSYGKYVAMIEKTPRKAQESPQKPRKRKRRFTDPQAFKLWQERKTDAQIAAAFGVSRAIIQRWRDTMELPSISKNTDIQTKKYRLVQDPDGNYYAEKTDTTE